MSVNGTYLCIKEYMYNTEIVVSNPYKIRKKYFISASHLIIYETLIVGLYLFCALSILLR